MPNHPQMKHNLIPYLNVKDAGAMIEFCKAAFDAEMMFALPGPDGHFMHVDMVIEDNNLCFSSMHPPHMTRTERKPTEIPPVTLMLYVKDVDATHARAVTAGAMSVEAPANMPWGDRMCRIVDPQGIVWMINQHVENVTPEELHRRMAEMSGGC